MVVFVRNHCWHERKGLKQVSGFRVPGFQDPVSALGFWVSSWSTTVVAQAAVSRVANVANPRTSEPKRTLVGKYEPGRLAVGETADKAVCATWVAASPRSEPARDDLEQASMRATQTQSSLIKPDQTRPVGSRWIKLDQAGSRLIKPPSQGGGGTAAWRFVTRVALLEALFAGPAGRAG